MRVSSSFRVIALLAAHNEGRFIAACIEHLAGHGVESYLIDNESSDATVAIAERYLGRGLIAIETFQRTHGEYRWHDLLQRKETLAESLDAHWFVHVDPDEVRLPPRGGGQLLAEALAEVDAAGYNAANFVEFTFMPTHEAPDHDHAEFQRTMRRYYAFLPDALHRVNAWRRQPARVSLAASGGHLVDFPGLRIAPVSFRMRHYPFLSVAHIEEKYGARRFSQKELQWGWHGWRSRLRRDRIVLPYDSELRLYTTDDALDASSPRTKHIAERWMGS